MSILSFHSYTTPSHLLPFRRRHSRNFSACSSAETLVSSSSAAGGEVGRVAEGGDLKSWLHSEGLPPCKVLLEDRPSLGIGEHGRSIHYVAASEDLKAGDVAFSVPNSLVVTLERVLGNEAVAELLTTNKLSELACLALYLMYEKKQGKKSLWYPFIMELDQQRGRGQLAVESPLLWSEDELAYLDGSPTRKFLKEKKGSRENTMSWTQYGLWRAHCLSNTLSTYPLKPFHLRFSSKHLLQFNRVLFICSFTSEIHAQGLTLTAAEDAVQLVVDRPYKAGESLVIWCGPQPNSRLILNYGFVDEDNPYDRIVIEASLNIDDPQYQEKKMIAQRNGKLAVQVFNVYVGREKDAVLDMLPYMRLGSLSDPSVRWILSFLHKALFVRCAHAPSELFWTNL